MHASKSSSIKKTLFISGSTALICAGAFIKIPLGLVPITLQTMFVLIAGLLLPLSLSLPVILTYLLLGILGIPVFSSGGGIVAILGPTGGYLIGLIPAVIVLSLFRKSKSLVLWICGAVISNLIIYACGVSMLMFSLKINLSTALSTGVLPFIIGDILKTTVAVAVSFSLKSKINAVLTEESDEE